MVKKITLKAEIRKDGGAQAKALLQAGDVPAVIYGRGQESKMLSLKQLDLNKAYAAAGESSLIDLVIDGGTEIKVIVKEVQKDVMTNKIIHADFYQVDMTKKIDVEIPLYFMGEPKAVKELGGTLVKSLDTLEIRCLPGDLVDKIDVDLTALNTFDDYIYVKDLSVPASSEVINHAEDIVANVLEPREEEPEPAAVEPVAAETKEKAGEDKAAGHAEEKKASK